MVKPSESSQPPSPLPSDFWKRNCTDDPEFAFEQYVQMYHSCFTPATSPRPYGSGSSSYFHKEGIKECRERLLARTSLDVSRGVAKHNVDDVLEMGLRLISGTHVHFDEETGIRLFERIIEGTFLNEKKAIAANLICQCLQRKILDYHTVKFYIMEAFKWANTACEYGLFSHSTLNLVKIHERFEKTPLDPEGYAKFTHVWKAYETFREETGMQRPKSRYCANCGKKPKKGETLKRCKGLCSEGKKPVYCGKECQKQHWPKHRRWCKVETVESDSEWTTDSEREDWEYSEDEPAPEPPGVPNAK